MRIDNFGRPVFDRQSNHIKRPAAATTSSSEMKKTSGNAVPRVQRLEELKQQFAAGKPIDVNQLADTLTQKGILFDEKV